MSNISFPLRKLGPLLLQSLERCGKKVLVAQIWFFGGPHLEALVLWRLNLILCFLENIIIITIWMYL